MSDYSKLKNYLSESKNGASSINSSDSNTFNGLNNVKDSMLGFFNKNVLRNDLRNSNNELKGPDEQSENWFKDAESDPFCPKLVGVFFLSFEIYLSQPFFFIQE